MFQKIEQEAEKIGKEVVQGVEKVVAVPINAAKAVERDVAAEFDELKARFEKLLEYLKFPHGIHFPH